MKIAGKGIGMMLIGLFVSVVLYPLLHEGGHSLAATILGGKVIEFRLFPLPSVLCNIAGLGDTAIAMIGMSGIAFPLLLSIFVNPKPFWLWYGNTLLRGISILALMITVTSTVMYLLGYPIKNEDITMVLDCFDEYLLVLMTALSLAIMLIIKIIRSHPVKRIVAYFGV